MSRSALPAALIALGVLSAGMTVPAQTTSNSRRGVVFSEIHHVSRGDGLPTYIELLNLDPLSPVNLSGATVLVQSNTGLQTAFTFPPGSMIPPYSRTVNSGGTATPGTGTLTLVAGSGPPLTNPTEGVVVASSLFPTPGVLDPGAAGATPWTVCLAVPSLPPNRGGVDTVLLNGGTGPCGMISQPFLGPLPYDGLVIRGYRVDSNTQWDFLSLGTAVAPPDPPYAGPPVGPSPTIVNPETARVSGFWFGSPAVGPGTAGVPFSTPPVIVPGTAPSVVSGLNSSPAAVTATVSLSTPPGAVAFIGFVEHPYASYRRQMDPQFDSVLTSGTLDVQTAFTGTNPLLSNGPAGTGSVVALNETWALTVPDPQTPGILRIDMGVLEQASVGFQLYNPQPATNPRGQQLRVERVLTDFITTAAATGSGNLSKVQIDVLPPEGDLWCELIVYDANGFSYRAKVRNWPNNPLECTTPNLGLGSNAVGNVDVVALCFDPQAELFVLPTMLLSSPTGSGPFFGIQPDGMTFSFLGLPVGTDPAHSVTTVDGLYFWSFTDPGLSGLSIDAVAVQWGTTGPSGAGFTLFSPAASLTIQ